MKKYKISLFIIIFSSLFCLWACGPSAEEKAIQGLKQEPQPTITQKAKLIYSVDNTGTKTMADTTCYCSTIDYYIYMVNGCEYIKFEDKHYAWGGHSGTCPNPIHLYKPEQIYFNPDSTNSSF